MPRKLYYRIQSPQGDAYLCTTEGFTMIVDRTQDVPSIKTFARIYQPQEGEIRSEISYADFISELNNSIRLLTRKATPE